MKRFLLFPCAAALFFFVCFTHAATTDLVNPYITSYPFKSAVIHYTIENEHIHGKTSGEVLNRIDQNGNLVDLREDTNEFDGNLYFGFLDVNSFKVFKEAAMS